mmetsp:Transcript_214/g.184  ORF Transcript_214/g.184 Transcript_214/m.184 type:complete len:80 (+) Transcript_214:89-328(+)
MQEEMQRAKQMKIEAQIKAKEEERKQFLLNRDVKAVLRMIDNKLKVKNTILEAAIEKDLSTKIQLRGGNSEKSKEKYKQ